MPLHTHRPPLLQENPWYSLSEAESTSGHMVLSGEPWKKSPVTTPGIDPGTVRLVVQCLNHYATPGPNYAQWKPEINISNYLPVMAQQHHCENTKPALCSVMSGIKYCAGDRLPV